MKQIVRRSRVEAKETRGRKRNPGGKILSNGLYKEQWAWILENAGKQGIDGAVLLRQIVTWYKDAKEWQEAKYSQLEEFKKLEK